MQTENFNSIPIDRISGLQPDLWVCVGAGFAREDVKSLVLSQSRGFVAEAITTLQEICIRLTGISKTQFLTSSARQEILRMLLAEPRIIAGMPELKRMKRQKNFIQRLDSSFQSARLAFAHPQEEEVLCERLKQTVGESPLREELRALSQAYEAWCEVSSCLDLPILIQRAIQVLRNGWPDTIRKPEEIWVLSIENPESLEREFWDTLNESLPIQRIRSLEDSNSTELPSIKWQKWHTLDDAAESFADEFLKELPDPSLWGQYAILIPDMPSIRRSLRRALEARGVPLADPRDPTRLRWDEWIKWAILPLEVVSRNFDRQKVISWLRTYQMQDEFSAWVTEINHRGIRNSLHSYSGGMLAGVHSRLNELHESFGGRKTCDELAEAHLKILRTFIGLDSQRLWLISFLEQTWKSFQSDIQRTGQKDKKAPLLFWLERLQARLSEASPPVERLKPRYGIQLYRLQQCPIQKIPKVWIFGLPPSWLSGDGSGDYWFSERDRDLLGIEFAVRGSAQIREERIRVLKSWLIGAERVTILDAHYDVDGRERESILPVLKEILLGLDPSLPSDQVSPDQFPSDQVSPDQVSSAQFPSDEQETLEASTGVYENSDIVGIHDPFEFQEMGSHPRFTQSYQVLRPIQPVQVRLPPLSRRPGDAPPELTATAIERYSRCSFQALAFHRWNVRDTREPDTELWPDIRGNILHEAVRIILASRVDSNHSSDGDGDGEFYFQVSPAQALEQAWKTKRVKGLVRSTRIDEYVKKRMLRVLDVFCEKEREYLKRSGAKALVLDNILLRLDYPEFSVIGQPDRIDFIQDGLFVIDYKTSGIAPNGSEMIERGYRLQLPFYALAAQKKTNRPVLGAQFIELDRKGTRRNGIFFKNYNGKTPGSLTNLRSNSKSLVSLSPDEAWSVLEDYLIQNAKGFIQGHFAAIPNTSKKELECSHCSVSDLCGLKRRTDADSQSSGSSPGESNE